MAHRGAAASHHVIDNRWYSVLDDFEAHHDGQADAIAAGRADLVAAFPQPPGLGALPPNLQGRASRLHRRSLELEASVADHRDDISRRLAAIPRRRSHVSPSGSLINHRA